MSEDGDALRELAANRGCKLVDRASGRPGGAITAGSASRTRRAGREVFGFGEKGLTATPEEIEAFLRGDGAVGLEELGRQGEAPPRPKPTPAPKPEPKLSSARARAEGCGGDRGADRRARL